MSLLLLPQKYYCKVILLLLTLCFCITSNSFAKSRRNKNQKLLGVYQQQHTALNKKFFAQIEELAQFCDRNKLANEAKKIRKTIEPVDPTVSKLMMLPSKVQPELSAELTATERHWRSELRKIQTEHAKLLYLLSQKIMKVGSPSFAYQLVHETAHYDPDNKSARRLLGFIRMGDQWVSPFAARMLKKGYVKHKKFGWLKKEYVKRYEKGERYYKRRWMSAAQEAEIRSDFKKAWRIETDHYIVKTNHSLEQGVKIANGLEDYYAFFFQTFTGFFNTPEQLKKLFSKGNTSYGYRSNRYEVHYFKSRDEYNRQLIRKMPQVTMTYGLYLPADKIVYSFHIPDINNLPTLYHEAVHQLFYQSTIKDRDIATRHHFWIVEGIACYMESFEQHGTKLSMGNPENPRFVGARHYLIKENYYVPLQQFTEMGMQAFQTDKNILKNYAQAAGLTHFFMHAYNGKYRDALISHLSQIYAPVRRRRRPPPVDSMFELTETPSQELDEQYKKYMQKMRKNLNEMDSKILEGS